MAKESTLVGFPYDSRLTGGSYDRAINSPTFRKLILKYFTTGVFPNPSTNLQVIANSGLNVTVKAGYANVNGVFCELKEDVTLNLDSTSTYSRIDRIVLRHDDNESVRATKLMILKGTADNNPQPANLTRNETVYDICLANVTVKTSGTITQAEISDTRLSNDVCGIVTGTIKNVDTTTLYNQIQSDLDQFKENEKQEWNRWFNAIKEELGQIDVGQLTQDVQQIKTDYVPKLDIVNNLTSGGTNKPLSAEQGKVLNNTKKGKMTLSVSQEVLTGDTWVDGKPIYKKVFHTGALNPYQSINTNHGISVGSFIVVDPSLSFAYSASANTFVNLPRPARNASADAVEVRCTGQQFTIVTGNEVSFSDSYITLIYTKA